MPVGDAFFVQLRETRGALPLAPTRGSASGLREGSSTLSTPISRLS